MDSRRLFVHKKQVENALALVAKGDASEVYLIVEHFVQSIVTHQGPEDEAFAKSVGADRQPDPQVQRFIADILKKALNAYYEGKKYDLHTGLGLQYGKRRPELRRRGEMYRASEIGGKMYDLVEGGIGYEKALKKVMEEKKVSGNTVKKYHKLYEEYFLPRSRKDK